MRFSYLSDLECPRDGRRYDAGVPQKLCECGSPLLARYDLKALSVEVTRDEISAEAPSLWRCHALPPVSAPEAVVTLGEGMTLSYGLPQYDVKIGVPGLVVQDEALLPAGSFKGRGAAVGISRAKELGITRFAMPTHGNAGTAWSTYAATAGEEVLVFNTDSALKYPNAVIANPPLLSIDGNGSNAASK